MLYATFYVSSLFILTNLNLELNMNYEVMLVDVILYCKCSQIGVSVYRYIVYVLVVSSNTRNGTCR